MNQIRIGRFEFDQASDEHLSSYHQMMVASANDWAGVIAVEYDAAIGRLRNPMAGMEATERYAAYLGERIVGFVSVGFPEHENVGLAILELTVHPGHRRRGIGRDLLLSILPELRSRDRATIEGWGIPKGGSGEKWAVAMGFRRAQVTALQRLDITAVDPAAWDVDVPDGFRLQRWVGSAPSALLVPYALARNAIADAPRDDLYYQAPTWTAERVREAESRLGREGHELRVVVAEDEATREIAAFTEIELRAHRPETAYQRDTAVVPRYRGRGLGRAIKASMASWLSSDRPAVEHVYTISAQSNSHMIAVNRQIGYEVINTTIVFSTEVETVVRNLQMGACE